jgi:hypothetical protein
MDVLGVRWRRSWMALSTPTAVGMISDRASTTIRSLPVGQLAAGDRPGARRGLGRQLVGPVLSQPLRCVSLAEPLVQIDAKPLRSVLPWQRVPCDSLRWLPDCGHLTPGRPAIYTFKRATGLAGCRHPGGGDPGSQQAQVYRPLDGLGS